MCDCLNNRIQLFTSEGVFVSTFGTEGRGHGQFWRPMGVAVDSENRIVVVDQGRSRLETIVNVVQVFLVRFLQTCLRA